VVNLRTEAGTEGYLDDITISVDPDDERSWGPTGRALRTGETQVTHDTRSDARHDPWREDIEEYGIRSSAAVPIVHGATVYGALNIYAGRPDAFRGDEREVISQLGEVVGHAIAAAERKHALMSDELVELEFRVQDAAAVDGAPATEQISFDHTVAIGDGEFLVYGTAPLDAVDTLERLVGTVPHWESVTVRSSGDPAGFELKLCDPPVLSLVASLGGYVASAAVENGDYRMTIRLAPSSDVGRVIDAVRETYPDVEMLRRQQVDRARDDAYRVKRRSLRNLTDRQRSALEAAYRTGYFEWPRATSGEEIAESLGVSSPTFHQHLRKAHRKVLTSVFSSPEGSAESRSDPAN
jgi:hypothetical protein